MANQKLVKPQPEKKTGHKPEPAVIGDSIQAFADITGLLNMSGDISSQRQEAWLGAQHLNITQRQTIAKRINQLQGNYHLQRVLQPYKNKEDTDFSIITRGVIQRDTHATKTIKPIHSKSSTPPPELDWPDASHESAQTSQPVKDDKIQVPTDTGWNTGEIKVGSIRRILISGLKHGRQSNAEMHPGYSGSTTESAIGKAVILIPDDFDETDDHPTTVLLHFHGYGSGYRQLEDPAELQKHIDDLKVQKSDLEQDLASKEAQKTTAHSELQNIRKQIKKTQKQIIESETKLRGIPDFAANLKAGQVRDIELYRMEQQLDQLHKERQMAKKARQALGPQIIAVLPQGGSSSEFGNITSDPLGYLTEVLGVLPTKIEKYNLSISGHSGGGPKVMQAAEKVRTHKAKPGELQHNVNQIILFDAINGSAESEAVGKWLKARIAEDRKMLSKMKTTAEVDSYFKARTAFRGYFSPGYQGLYEEVKAITDELDRLKSSKKDPSLSEYKQNKLAEQYQVIGPIGEKVKPDPGKKLTREEEFRPHEHLMGAKNDPSKFGLLYEALSALP